jgi:hypothetical protein
MINALIIGTPGEVERYTELVRKSNYFRSAQSFPFLDNTEDTTPDFGNLHFDAVIFTGKFDHFYHTALQLAKSMIPVYFAYQPQLTKSELNEIEKTITESECIFFHETTELEHPIFQDFIQKQHRNLQFDYKRSTAGKSHIREALHNALTILSALSPMPIKRFNFSSYSPDNVLQNGIHIELQLFDHSECNIKVWINKNPFHQLNINSTMGNFFFDLYNSFIQNSSGTRFLSEVVSEDDLLFSSLEKFALCIILQKQPSFTFQQYTMIHNTLGTLSQFLSL